MTSSRVSGAMALIVSRSWLAEVPNVSTATVIPILGVLGLNVLNATLKSRSCRAHSYTLRLAFVCLERIASLSVVTATRVGSLVVSPTAVTSATKTPSLRRRAPHAATILAALAEAWLHVTIATEHRVGFPRAQV